MRSRNRRLTWSIIGSILLLLLGPPVFGVFGSILGAKFASLFFSDTHDLDSDYLALSVSLILENAELREMAAKSQLYRSMLEYTRMPDIDAVVGRVMYRSEGLIRGNFVIDRGLEHGIYTGAVCVSPMGLVGIVSSVEARNATVVPITSPSIHVSCITSTSGALGILGAEAEGSLKLLYIDSSVIPVLGETVITSRFGGVYPEGIVVGTVSEIDLTDNELDISLSVEPSVNFDRVNEVLILLSEEEESDNE